MSSVQMVVLNVKTIYDVFDPTAYVIFIKIVMIILTRMKSSVEVK